MTDDHEAATRAGPLRFTRDDVIQFLHQLHPIPLTRGYTLAWVDKHAPGWTFGMLGTALRDAGAFVPDPTHFSGRGPAPGLVWIDMEPQPDGTVVSTVACSSDDTDAEDDRPYGFVIPGSVVAEVMDLPPDEQSDAIGRLTGL